MRRTSLKEMDFYKEGFQNDFVTLFTLSKIAKDQRGLELKFFTTTGDVAGILGVSQQTASRRLDTLSKAQLIHKTRKSSGLEVTITQEGIDILSGMLDELKLVFGLKIRIQISGFINPGLQEGSYYISIYQKEFEEVMGYKPFLGTLNLRLKEVSEIEKLEQLMKTITPQTIPGFVEKNRKFGAVDFWTGTALFKNKANQTQKTEALLIRPRRTHHPGQLVELVARQNLRDEFGLVDGDLITWVLGKIE